MIKPLLTETFDNNWFFISTLTFAVVLPFSPALVSVIAAIMLITAFTEDSSKNKIQRIKNNKILFLIPLIFVFYLASAIFSGPLNKSLYDLQKNLFYLIIPLAFIIGKNIKPNQKRFLFFTFASAVFIATIVAFLRWKNSGNDLNITVHKASLVSHIRFSFQLILVFWFLVLFSVKNFSSFNKKILWTLAGLALYTLLFLAFQQSLTGMVAAISGFLFFAVHKLFSTKGIPRFLWLTGFLFLVIVPVALTGRIITGFYRIEKVDQNKLEKYTQNGNPYQHDLNHPMVENGRYVYLYLCEQELREEWNKRSVMDYDSTGPSGFPVHATLIRYMTSRHLTKDAEGMEQMTDEDIHNVEQGITNVKSANSRFSLFPRIYQTVWEYYMYTQTGNPNQQSFSQRIEYARAALRIIQNNFWTGVGTANWKDEFKKMYEKNQSRLSEQNFASSHNQYLNYTVKFGFPGMLVILFLLIFPVFKKNKQKNLLFLIFLVFMFFANFADSNLETHMGSSFFVFFYCLFMQGDESDFLVIRK